MMLPLLAVADSVAALVDRGPLYDAHRAIARLRVQHPGIAAYWVMREAK